MSLFPDGLGWAATTVFAVSYFFKRQARLRLAQALAMDRLRPADSFAAVAVANLIVSSLALYSAWRGGGVTD